MSFLLDFFNKNSNGLLFLLLIAISISLIINTQNYPKTVFFSKLFCMESSISEKFADARNFIYLNKDNKVLQEENKELREENIRLKKAYKGLSFQQIDTINTIQTYEVTSAEIINTIQRNQNNYYTLDVGTRDNIKDGDGVITNSGIIGHIAKADPEYSIILSILHPNTRIKSRIKNTDYFGILKWNGEDSRIMQLTNIDKYINVQLYDTIETYKSTIYPEGVPIGKIIEKNIDAKNGKWNLNIQLFQNMSDLRYVYVVNNIEKVKIDSLELKSENFDVE